MGYLIEPFTKVLVRSTEKSKWKANFFDYYKQDDTFPYVTINKAHWRFCIPYEGNERLHGTTEPPIKTFSL